MKFGRVDHPELIDFSLPQDHTDTKKRLSESKDGPLNIFVGCAKWNRQDLKHFYPRGIKDELGHYSSQFNSIELNATFYRIFPKHTYDQWYDVTPDDFRFFPKVVNRVSHLRRLNDNIYPIINEYLEVTSRLKEKLGTIFLQMHSNFGPKNWDRVVKFIEYWPKEFPLAIEFRHADWYNDTVVANEIYQLLHENNIANILVDTAGRRDMLHMRLSNNEAFVRYVGANHPTDYERLDEWVVKIASWREQGLKNIHFFIHQNMELASPLLSAYFIGKLNEQLGVKLHIPKTLVQPGKLY